jgi:hypothetical protein
MRLPVLSWRCVALFLSPAAFSGARFVFSSAPLHSLNSLVASFLSPPPVCTLSRIQKQRSKLIRSFLQSGESNSHFENRAPSIFGNGVGGAPSAPASPRFAFTRAIE